MPMENTKQAGSVESQSLFLEEKEKLVRMDGEPHH